MSAALPLANLIRGSSTTNVAVSTVTVSPLTIKSPVTVKSFPIVTTSFESPMVTAFEPKPPANLVFRLATETSSLAVPAILMLPVPLVIVILSPAVNVDLVSVLPVVFPMSNCPLV